MANAALDLMLHGLPTFSLLVPPFTTQHGKQ
jgi:hypothetical protein